MLRHSLAMPWDSPDWRDIARAFILPSSTATATFAFDFALTPGSSAWPINRSTTHSNNTHHHCQQHQQSTSTAHSAKTPTTTATITATTRMYTLFAGGAGASLMRNLYTEGVARVLNESRVLNASALEAKVTLRKLICALEFTCQANANANANARIYVSVTFNTLRATIN